MSGKELRGWLALGLSILALVLSGVSYYRTERLAQFKADNQLDEAWSALTGGSSLGVVDDPAPTPKELAEAIRMIRDAEGCDPSNLRIPLYRAFHRQLSGDLGGAIEQYKELRQRAPGYAPAYD